MSFDRTQQELLNYVKSNNIWKLFVPVAEFLLVVGGCVQVVNNFVSIGVFSSVVGILTWIAIVIVLAKGNYKVLTIGLALRVIEYAISFLKPLISSYPRLQIGTLLYGLVWFCFLIAAYKKSGMTVNEFKTTVTSKEGIKNTMNLNEAKTFNVNEAADSFKNATSEAMETINKVKSEVQQQQPSENTNKEQETNV